MERSRRKELVSNGGETLTLKDLIIKDELDEISNAILNRDSDGEASVPRELDGRGSPKCLLRNVSFKKCRRNRKKNRKADKVVNVGSRKRLSSGCLKWYRRGGGCKVASCEEFEIMGRSKCGVEECLGVEKPRMETIRKKSVTDEKEMEGNKPSSAATVQSSLPDDILEMCLIRLPLTALMTARLVCKKWRSLTTSAHFMRVRYEGMHQSPWLFLFGINKDDSCTSEIHALDISMDQWHKVNAEVLQGRFSFSVASIGTDLYMIGGCSSLNRHAPPSERNSYKTHRSVFVFSPLKGSWCKASPMKSARLEPVVGVFEVNPSCWAAFNGLPEQPERRVQRSRVGGVSDIYEDPHRCSLRREATYCFDNGYESPDFKSKASIVSDSKNKKKFAIIAVGGLGLWDEPLDSGEVYNPMKNRWMDIAKLPCDFGPACSGAVCNSVFYVYSESDKLAGYNFEWGVWVQIQTQRPPSRLREFHPKLVCCDDRLFMLSVSWCERDRQQYRREKAVRKLWELNLAPFSWTEVSRHPDAPMDWNAAFVADRNQIYGLEKFRIFCQVLDFLTVCDVSGNETRWNRIPRRREGNQADTFSCIVKALAALHL